MATRIYKLMMYNMANQYTNKKEYKYEGNILYIKCVICGERYTLDQYPKDKGKKFGVRGECKKCRKGQAKLIHRKWYINNKEKAQEKAKSYYSYNSKELYGKEKRRLKTHNVKLGFSWGSFHLKARKYVKEHNLKPDKCSICGLDNNIEMHHPSYDNSNDWSKVVFCCRRCHKGIHLGDIVCPNPIDLLECVSPKKESSQES